VLSETGQKLKRPDGALVTGILVIAVLYFARDVFIPLALAGLLAFLLAPAATRLERWRVGRTLAAILVIVLSLVGTMALGWVVLGQIYNLAIDLPQYQQNVTEKLDSLHLNSAGKLGNTVAMLTSLSKQIKNGGTANSQIPRVMPRQRMASRAGTIAASSANNTPQPVAVQIEEPDASMTAVAERTMIPLVHPLATGRGHRQRGSLQEGPGICCLAGGGSGRALHRGQAAAHSDQ
jgi:AI-2E family transporter